MKRRQFLKSVGLGTGVLAISPWLTSCVSFTDSVSVGKFINKLPLPGEINNTSFELTASPADIELSDDITLAGFQFNGSVPGPTIRQTKGSEVDIQFNNGIGQDSIIHWHGLIVPPEMDGHPKDVIAIGSYDYRFSLNQRTGTYWYHPHPHRITGEQVYRGLAGFFIIEDEEEKALNLPRGKYELPLLIQDRKVNDNGQVVYDPSMPERMMTGFLGDTILVNGVPAPFHEVEAGTYRLRILNGSNARIYNLAFEHDLPFTVIGTDGGLLPEAIETDELLMAPGERADLLVDFSKVKNQNRVQLVSKPFDVPGGGGMMGGMQNMMGSDAPEQGGGFSLMEFRIDGASSSKSVDLPNKLSESTFPKEADANRSRPIRLAMEMMTGHTINGRQFEMERVDERVPQGDTEIWEFINNSNVPHPMHVHAVQFKVLDRSGARGLIPTETGWKDTVLVMPGETVRVIMKFDAEKGMYVFHCHNLEHEDNGMMANLEII
ncbi:multicopper oxidase family protein [Gracilimonas mengyeensis]|uniref:Multicopper oxidase with three cupredoxin domains (Includes cell division protein FtsP and spore coat protein CotA) n=1 Tax=Gracilimonas mengyeensis TaxID=1302730 RepID=A0A521CX91_9BACT|nr:multicopper oxidase family protein [Gracilimonas mengyeensis]SMO64063.1 Multicopper oxidase with three cupredoxin domains (includes cell division protein FtsP and spore coat protein CotA) [Gracilimonas mengyeensis]